MRHCIYKGIIVIQRKINHISVFNTTHFYGLEPLISRFRLRPYPLATLPVERFC